MSEAILSLLRILLWERRWDEQWELTLKECISADVRTMKVPPGNGKAADPLRKQQFRQQGLIRTRGNHTIRSERKVNTQREATLY